MWNSLGTKALVITTLVVVLLSGGQAEAACIKWSDARGVIAKHGLKKPGEVRRRAMRRGGEVISINLCRRGGRYIYRLTVIGKKARVRDIVVDARKGKKNSRKLSRDRRLEKRIIKRVRRNLRRYGIDYY